MKNIICSIKKNECVGCKACSNVCPHNAIEFKSDNEGFWYPDVDTNKCTNCGLCVGVCPATCKLTECHNAPKAYMAWSLKPEVRDASTSGGIFYELAKCVIEEGGVVVGSRYADDFKSAFHTIAQTMEELNALVGTKYLQSDTGDIFKRVLKYLREKKKVLFAGTPCQCAAMKLYVKDNTDSEKLYLMDFVCNSIYSPLVYRKWLEELEKKEHAKVVRVRAKSKKYGWTNRYTEIEFDNGNCIYQSDFKGENHYIAGIHEYGMYQRYSCYNCKFREEQHKGSDLTVGDFWELAGQSEYDMFKGISFVIANSEKGNELFSKIKKRLFVKQCTIDEIRKGQIRMLNNPVCHPKREEFFRKLQKNELSRALYLTTKYEIPPKKSEFKKIIEIMKRKDIAFFRYIYLNYFCKSVIRKGEARIIPYKNSVIEIDKNAKLILEGFKDFEVGKNKLKGSKAETFVSIEKDARITLLHGADMCYGSTLELKNNAKFKSGFFTMNTGSVIVVDYEMEFGEYVGLGRNNTIYDSDFHKLMTSSGNAFNRPQKISIGDHVWITSNVTILPGAKLGNNIIISPHSIIKHPIPSESYYKDGKSSPFPGWWSDKANNKYQEVLKNKKIVMVGFGREGKVFYERYKEKIEYIIDNGSSDERTIKFKDFVKKKDYLDEKFVFVITSSKFYEELYLMVRKQYEDAFIISGSDI